MKVIVVKLNPPYYIIDELFEGKQEGESLTLEDIERVQKKYLKNASEFHTSSCQKCMEEQNKRNVI